MSELFWKLVNMSISAGWFILAVVLVRLVFRKAPKWFNCLLWALVAVRLICPFSIESSLSLVPDAKIVDTTTDTGRLYIQSGITTVDNTVNTYLGKHYDEDAAAPVKESEKSVAGPVQIMAIVWLTGIFGILVYALISYLRLQRRVRESVQFQGNVFLCDRISTPFILGIVKPRIYLPSDMNELHFGSVIAHEQAHISRRDYLWKPLGYVLLAVYWFQPLCWLAYILLCRDIEMACDEKVVRNMDVEAKKAYSMALLSCSISGKTISACPLAFGEVGVKERIKGILYYKKPTLWVLIVSALVCVVAAVCFLTKKPVSVEVGQEAGDTEQRGRDLIGTDMDKTNSTQSDFIEVKVPMIDLEATTGADGSMLYYAGQGKFIFGGYYGLFVYDLTNQEIIQSVDLTPIGCNMTQGDAACEISVTEDGMTVFLHPMNQEQMYVYRVADNTMEKVPYHLEGYDLYHNQYNGKEKGKYASYEKDGETRYVALVNDMTIGELGFTLDERMSSYQLIFGDQELLPAAEVDNEMTKAYGDEVQNSKSSDGSPSRAYIDYLQEQISAAMTNGELPFVTSSAVMENPLHLEVRMKDMSEENIKKIRSYETMGEAITIVESKGENKLEDLEISE